MVNMVDVVGMMRKNFNMVNMMANITAGNDRGRGGVALGVDQLLHVGYRPLLEERMSAGGVVDMTRAVGHNVEVRRVIGDLQGGSLSRRLNLDYLNCAWRRRRRWWGRGRP